MQRSFLAFSMSLVVILSGLVMAADCRAQPANPFSSAQPGYPGWSPFSAVRWEGVDGKTPIVRIENAWYELVSIHGISTAEILQFCRDKGWNTKQRFAEDLVQIIRLMGHEIDKKTDLVLLDEAGEVVMMHNITMTEESRNQVSAGAVVPNLAGNPFLSSVPGYPAWSAFTGVRWEGDQPVVRVGEKWYELVSFHGIPTAKILAFCEENGWPVRMRFTEDLVQIVRLMGHEIEKTTDLVLMDDEGSLVNMRNVEMTLSNLRRVVQTGGLPNRLSREDVLSDLASFQESLEAQFSYLHANGADYEAAIAVIGEKAADGMDATHLAMELQKLIALFIDGHAGVGSSTAGFATGYLPLLIEPSGDRFVAIQPDRSGFVDAELPYLRAIDGIELEQWLEAAGKYVAQGSPQYRLQRGLRLLRFIQQFRGELGRETDKPLQVELVSPDGQTHRTIAVDVSDEMATYGTWPPVRQPEILPGNIGYMRLEQMDGEAERLLREWMPKFRDTDGLIVDVRGNGGGIRTPLFELAGYLLTKSDTPRIGNVAKYRLAAQFGEDHLSGARFLYREDSGRFDEREREEVRRFRQSFAPEWEPPHEEFSPWHYLVLAKRADDPRFDYGKPVVILLDEGCFSATDIFLGAFKGWPNVTLIGQPSGGGSARSQSFQLPCSSITVRCASMASFQPNGKLYDGHGIQPDIPVVRPPEYYVEGGADVILEKALATLQDLAAR